MTNSYSSSEPKPSSRLNPSRNPAKSKVFWVFAAASVLGLADATYLTVSHYQNQLPSCSIVSGCEQVLTSEYATLLGIPIALFGVLYYGALFLSISYARLTGLSRLWQFFQLTLGVGVLVTAVLVYLQIFVIQAACQYCMISAGLTAAMAAAWLFARFRRADETAEPALNQ